MQSVQPKNGPAMTAAACLWLGAFPLLQGGTYAHITYDKWLIMLIFTGITAACCLFDLVWNRKARLSVPKVPLLLAAGLLLWTVLSCLLSAYGPETWWLGESARREGLLTHLCYFALFFCFFFSRVNLKPVLISAAVGVTAFFVIVMLQRAGGNPLGLYPTGRGYAYGHEFQGTIGNVDMGTGYLLLLSGLFLTALVKRSIFLIIVYALGLGLSVYLIITMEVQFGVISLAVLLLFTLLRFLPKKWRLPLLVLIILLVLVVVWFWPGQGGGIWELHEILHGRGRLSFGSNRVAVWKFSLLLARENLLLGGGSGTFDARFNSYIKEHNLVIPKEQDGLPLPNYFDNPHSEYVSQLTDHGLPALLLFLALILFSLFRRREGWFPLLSPCSAAVLCYAVQAAFSFSVCIVAPMFWVVLGLSFRDRPFVLRSREHIRTRNAQKTD